MHEYAIAEELVRGLLRELAGRRIRRVSEVHLRRASAFAPDAVGAAFEALAAGTPLAGARIRLETKAVAFACACGERRTVDSGDLVGHFYVCPRCGAVKEIEEAHDLELVDVVVDDEGAAS